MMKITAKNLPRGVWALGLVSLFMDVSSEIIHSLLPVFLVSILGASITSIGILEGFSEAVVLICKVFSGPLSDLMGRRKPLVVLGYTIGALSKPFFAMAGSFSMVFGARVFDRIGKGIRGAPRDALIADITSPEIRGSAFGFRQSLDTIGAVCGPLLAILMMGLTSDDYRLVFWLATIPGALAVLILMVYVKESRAEKRHTTHISMAAIKTFRSSFWAVAGVGALFQLARFSEAFLVLRAKDVGLSITLAPLVFIVMNVVYALSAYPIGAFSDRIPRKWFLVMGFIVLCLSDLALGLGKSLSACFMGVALWGLHLGLTQGTLAALVADTGSSEHRGTAYGIFNLFSAISLMLASVIAGVLWETSGPKFTFLVGSFIALVSTMLLITMLLTRPRKDL